MSCRNSECYTRCDAAARLNRDQKLLDLRASGIDGLSRPTRLMGFESDVNSIVYWAKQDGCEALPQVEANGQDYLQKAKLAVDTYQATQSPRRPNGRP